MYYRCNRYYGDTIFAAGQMVLSSTCRYGYCFSFYDKAERSGMVCRGTKVYKKTQYCHNCFVAGFCSNLLVQFKRNTYERFSLDSFIDISVFCGSWHSVFSPAECFCKRTEVKTRRRVLFFQVIMEETFLEMVSENKDLILRICRIYCNTDSCFTIDDLYQEIVLNMWKGYPKYLHNKCCKASTWLYKVAINTALFHHRNEKKHITKR